MLTINDDIFNEIAIEWIRGSKVATISAYTGSKIKGRIMKLKESNPDEVDVHENKDGSICAHVPIRWVKISPPRQMTEEQKIAAGERMRQLHEKNRE